MYKQKQWKMNKIEVQKTINIQTQGTILQKKIQNHQENWREQLTDQDSQAT
jgi:hypothetical protein